MRNRSELNIDHRKYGGNFGWYPSCLTHPKEPFKVYMGLIIKGTIPRAPPRVTGPRGFCRQMGLIHPVMQQLSSAMQQLKRQGGRFYLEIVSGNDWLMG